MNATDQPSPQTGGKPTIVLVHGAYADASSWNGVIERLQQQGYTVIAPANRLRGVTFDSAYTASLLNQIDGPVLLAGHSYGGAVITNAATSAPNVVGLVFVAAFAPEERENLGDIESGSKDSVLNEALVQYTYPVGSGGQTAVEFTINHALIRQAFAADLPPETTALMAATQRPIAAAAFPTSGPAAEGCRVAWSVTGDKAAGLTSSGHAERADADIVGVEGSHGHDLTFGWSDHPQADCLSPARPVETEPSTRAEGMTVSTRSAGWASRCGRAERRLRGGRPCRGPAGASAAWLAV